jgi:diguanylate cyclase (GGDEF)-like protein
LQARKQEASNSEAILNSLAKITEGAEYQTIVMRLVDSVLDVAQVDCVALLQVESADNPCAVSIEAFATRGRQDQRDTLVDQYHAAIQACVDGRQTLAQWHDGRYVVAAPILSLTGKFVESLTLTVSAQANPNDEILVVGFTTILQNFLRVLKEGERDGLTSLLNRKRFQDRVGALINKQRASLMPDTQGKNRRKAVEVVEGEAYWLGILDIDHFKRINDEFGHLFGDEVILMVARTLTTSFRDDDLIFRYGGEEFVVVVGPTTKEVAIAIFERLRKKIENTENRSTEKNHNFDWFSRSVRT